MLIAGDAAGRVYMAHHDGIDPIWIYRAEEQAGRVRRVWSFDDVDLGNSLDVLVLFQNGTLRCISSAGDVEGVEDDAGGVPVDARLASLYPNPFNGALGVDLNLNRMESVRIGVYGLDGRVISTVERERLSAGHHSIRLDPTQWNVSSGVYLINVQTSTKRETLHGVYLK
jgi:hypothetical protein